MLDDERSRPDVTVHHWTRLDEDLQSQGLLEAGHHLVNAGAQITGWKTKNHSSDSSIFRNHTSCFIYALPAPHISEVLQYRHDVKTAVVMEWGVELDADEVFWTADLDEFEGTDFDLIFAKDVKCTGPHDGISEQHNVVQDGMETDAVPPLPVKQQARDVTEPCREEPPRKRRKLDGSSLYPLVPQPHYYPLPSAVVMRPPAEVDLTAVPATRKYKSIHPHTSASIKDFLEDPYARGAWVIPLRGVLPWERCTPASVVDEESASVNDIDVGGEETSRPTLLPSGPLNRPEGTMPLGRPEITWTRDALTDFWAFLLSLRAARTLGAMSISFHAAPVPRTGVSSESTPLAGHAPESTSPYIQAGTAQVTAATHLTLLSVDHMKIYHDTRYSMQLRNVLSAWWYKCPHTVAPPNMHGTAQHLPAASEAIAATSKSGCRRGSFTMSSQDPKRGSPGGEPVAGGDVSRIRIFKGAKLALVDERSKGVLTS